MSARAYLQGVQAGNQLRKSRDAEATDKVLAEGLRDFGQPAPTAAPLSTPDLAGGLTKVQRQIGPVADQMSAGSPGDEGIANPPTPRMDPAIRTPGIAPDPVPAPAAPPARDFRSVQQGLVGRLARSGVPGTGRMAFDIASRLYQNDDATERTALIALAKGDDATYQHLTTKLGRSLVPSSVLADARQRRIYGSGALIAERFYKQNPSQAQAFIKAYLQDGDVQRAFESAGAPWGAPINRGQAINFVGQDGQEYAGMVMFGQDGRPMIQPISGPGGGRARVAPTARPSRGTAGGGNPSGLYMRARTRALAELKSEQDPLKPAQITPDMVEQRTQQILQTMGVTPPTLNSGGVPAAGPMPRPEAEPEFNYDPSTGSISPVSP